MNMSIGSDPAMRDHFPSHLTPKTRSFRLDFVRGSLITLLTMATAIALFASGWILSNPAVADPRPAGAETVVRDFYAAVNQTIHSGDASALNPAVDEHAEMHGPLATVAPSRDGLTRYLLSLHVTNPQLELQVTGMTITGSRAVVEVDVRGADGGSFLGGALPKTAQWGAIDGLRIGNGRVLELWSEASGVALLETVGQVPATFAQIDPRTIELDRLTIEPTGSYIAGSKSDQRWLIGETSNLTVISTPLRTELTRAPLALDPLQRTLKPGQMLPVSTWSKTEIRNTGRETGSLLVLTIAVPAPKTIQAGSSSYRTASPEPIDSSLPGWWTGTPHQLGSNFTLVSVTNSIEEELPADHLNVTLAQATLTPGTILTDVETSGPTLLAITSGTLDLVSEDRSAANYRKNATHHDIDRIEAPYGAVIRSGSHAYFNNPGPEPVVVTIIALLPNDVTIGGNA